MVAPINMKSNFLAKIRADGTYEKLVQKHYPGIQRWFPAFFEKHRARPK
jgi:hypothetical protein